MTKAELVRLAYYEMSMVEKRIWPRNQWQLIQDFNVRYEVYMRRDMLEWYRIIERELKR